MSAHMLTLNVSETLTVCARQKVRTCLLFPDRVVGIKPVFHFAADTSMKVSESAIELKDMFRIECIGNCVFIDKNIKISAANMSISIYVIYADTVQALKIVNATEEAEEADIYLLKP